MSQGTAPAGSGSGSGTGSGKIRAFVALDLDPPMRARLDELIASLQGVVPGVRWVRPEGVHITLRFLGWSAPEALERLKPALRRAAAACPRGEADLGGVGLFPERGSPRVLWLAVRLPEPVFVLQAECERAAVEAGFAPEPRPFRPHLTLGRFKERARRPSLPPTDLGATQLDSLVLFRSQLQQGGAVYTPLEVFPLGDESPQR